jgi:hydrogenase expression/formation protein HypC
MCLGIPGQIVSLDSTHPDLAMVDVSGVPRMINLGMLDPGEAGPGDWILIHLGFALQTMKPEEAREAMVALDDIGPQLGLGGT